MLRAIHQPVKTFMECKALVTVMDRTESPDVLLERPWVKNLTVVERGVATPRETA